jgi:hypothetical protein
MRIPAPGKSKPSVFSHHFLLIHRLFRNRLGAFRITCALLVRTGDRDRTTEESNNRGRLGRFIDESRFKACHRAIRLHSLLGQLFHRSHSLTGFFIADIGIHGGDRRATVPQLLLHQSQILARLVQQRGRSMTSVMQPMLRTIPVPPPPQGTAGELLGSPVAPKMTSTHGSVADCAVMPSRSGFLASCVSCMTNDSDVGIIHQLPVEAKWFVLHRWFSISRHSRLDNSWLFGHPDNTLSAEIKRTRLCQVLNR